MPSATGLLATDAIISNNFYLELDGELISSLISVSGLDIEMDVTELRSVGTKGQSILAKTVSQQWKVSDISVTRLAPVDSTQDKLWMWFTDIREKGLKTVTRDDQRKNGSIVLYGSDNTEISRFNFQNAFPSKIATDQLSADSNDAVKETITLVCERLERKK